MDSISKLPTAVLAQILQQHIPLQQRMQSCAVVCSTWAAAAAMATTKIDLQLTPAKVPALHAWLGSGQRAQQLVSFALQRPYGWRETQMQLACAGLVQLTSLELDGIAPLLPCAGMARAPRAAMRSSNSSSGADVSSAGLPKLVRLRLRALQLASTTALLQLSSLARLTQLGLSSVSLPSSTKQPVKQLSTALAQVLHLPCLQFLSIHSMELDAIALVPHLPAGLTSLECTGCGRWSSGERAMLPARLPQLSKLHCLTLWGWKLHPAVLGSMHQLQELLLEECWLLKEQHVASTSPPVAVLLDALGCMRHLTSLHVRCDNLDCSSVPAQAFSALTVSSGLQHLTFDMQDKQAPFGAVQHMFPACKQLLHMTGLFFESITVEPEPRAGYMTSADLCSIAAACPSLERLGLQGALLPDAERGMLRLPTSCTSLGVAGLAVGDKAAACIGKLTQLRHLLVRHAPTLTDVGFEHLTALQGLTRLMINFTEGLSQQVLAAALNCGPDEPPVEDYEIDFSLRERVSVAL